jgi:elongation factor 1-gamma
MPERKEVETMTSSTTHYPSYTLYVPEASFRAFAILIAAEINGVDITVNTVELDTTLSKTGKLPVLTWQEEDPPNDESIKSISTSAAIARYIAALRTDTNLCGNASSSSSLALVRRAEIDAWLDWCITDLELPATVWFYPAVGYMAYHEMAYRKARHDMTSALNVLEQALLTSSSSSSSSTADGANKTPYYYLVGSHLTLADIIIISTLIYPFKFVCDDVYRAPFPHVTAWFSHCTQLPAFSQVVGIVPLCKTELLPPTTMSMSMSAPTTQT